MDDNFKEDIHNRLFMFLKSEDLVNEYIDAFGYDINMKKVNDLKQQQIEIFDEKESAMYTIEVSCPICKTKLKSFELKARSLQVKENRFRVPFYYDSSNYKAIDYNRYRVTVCPKCLFASPDIKDFNKVNSFSKKEEYSQIPKNILYSIDEDENRRIALVNNNQKIIDSFSNFPRSIRSSVYSYKLAILRAIVEEKHVFPNAYLKHGGYILRLIKLSREMGETEDKIFSLYVKAYQIFSKGFESSNFTTKDFEFYNLYLLIATALYVDRFDEAIKIRAQLPILIEKCESNPTQYKEALKWVKNINELFDYIDDVRSWDNPRS